MFKPNHDQLTVDLGLAPWRSRLINDLDFQTSSHECCSNWNPSENFEKRQKAANLCGFIHLQQASQASDVGSIPIARSINPVDAVEFTGFPPRKFPIKTRVLDAVGRGFRPQRASWTRRLGSFSLGPMRYCPPPIRPRPIPMIPK